MLSMNRRGTDQSPPNRFLPIVLAVDEYCDQGSELEEPKSIHTELFEDDTQSIVSENQSPDVPFHFSVNPYRGCEHGCSYCYARPYHEYLGWNAGIDFETKILVKTKAAELLRKWLSRPSWSGKEHLTLSGVTDPYQPIERKLKITRSLLEVFLESKQAVSLITKNALITRDLDILSQLASLRATRVALSITTLDSKLSGVLEPRCSIPEARIRAVSELSNAGIPVHVNIAPLIPGLNDHEVPMIVEAAAKAGASTVAWTLLRLPGAVEQVFIRWLEQHRPLAKQKILQRIRALRRGRLHDSDFSRRMKGEGFFSDEFEQLFKVLRKKHGLDKPQQELEISHFVPPRTSSGQGFLF